MVKFSCGLPVLAHEIGDAVWRKSNGPVIEAADASVDVSVGGKNHW